MLPTRSRRRPDIVRAPAEAAQRAAAPEPALPEWNLADLYAAPDDPAFAADLDRAATESAAFAEAYRGRIAALAEDRSGAALAEAVRRYEALDELLGRIGSYAGLVYAGDTSDPARGKFYGDTQERLTAATSNLLFFELELNRLDDDALGDALASGPLAHYRPWILDIRKGKPYQLDDRLEQLFHEKSVTAYSAWNRLFDETITALRFEVDGEKLAIEPVLNLLQDQKEETREKAAKALGVVFKDNLRQFALITNTLAKDKEISDRWRGFRDVADSRHLSNRVEPEVVDALVAAVRAAYPRLTHRYYRLKAKWFGKPALKFWDRNAPLPDVPARSLQLGGRARRGARRLWRFFAAHGWHREALLRRALDRRPGPARQEPRRLRPSDRAVGASLCAAQLSGQAARRDDARA